MSEEKEETSIFEETLEKVVDGNIISGTTERLHAALALSILRGEINKNHTLHQGAMSVIRNLIPKE